MFQRGYGLLMVSLPRFRLPIGRYRLEMLESGEIWGPREIIQGYGPGTFRLNGLASVFGSLVSMSMRESCRSAL